MSEELSNRRSLDHQAAQEIERLNDEWAAALVNRDGATLDHIMADDFIFLHPMEGDDKAQFIADVESGTLRVEALKRENVQVRVYGDAAILSCRDDATWQYGGRDFSGIYKALTVYARRAGRWQIVAIQSCHLA